MVCEEGDGEQGSAKAHPDLTRTRLGIQEVNGQQLNFGLDLSSANDQHPEDPAGSPAGGVFQASRPEDQEGFQLVRRRSTTYHSQLPGRGQVAFQSVQFGTLNPQFNPLPHQQAVLSQTWLCTENRFMALSSQDQPQEEQEGYPEGHYSSVRGTQQ